MPLDPRGVRQVCTVCRKPFYDLNRGLGCPHCQPKTAPTKPVITIELEEEPTMPMPASERRELIRKLLTEAPRRMAELEASADATAGTIRADLAAIGAVQQGNRLSPWTLPETPTEAPVEKPARKRRAPVAEAITLASDDVTAYTMQHLVACTNELTRRISAAQDALK